MGGYQDVQVDYYVTYQGNNPTATGDLWVHPSVNAGDGNSYVLNDLIVTVVNGVVTRTGFKSDRGEEAN